MLATLPHAQISLAVPPSADQALIARLIEDDPVAWREFTDRFSRLIQRCITRVIGRFGAHVGSDAVREIHADLCLQLIANDKHRLRSFEPGRGNQLGSWIGMLAIHTAYDHLRQIRREPQRTHLREAESLHSDCADPHTACDLRERAAWLRRILADFSAKDRRFVTLYYGEGLDPDQVAEKMNISVKTVYSKKHKIESRLEALALSRKLAA
jgi:RNA polymerase sigma-70 factor (ECF subfamily)